MYNVVTLNSDCATFNIFISIATASKLLKTVHTYLFPMKINYVSAAN